MAMYTSGSFKVISNSKSSQPPMDPDNLFVSKYNRAVKDSTGLALFAYKVIPFSLMKSFVTTFDPSWKFAISPHKVTVRNRTRKRSTAFVTDTRKDVYTIMGYIDVSEANYNGLGRFGPLKRSSYGGTTVTSINTSPPTWLRSVDTTRRTRDVGSDFGEFESFTFKTFSPPRCVFDVYDNKISVPGAQGSLSWNIEYRTRTHLVGPDGARLQTNAAESLRTQSLTYCTSLMTKHGPGMLARSLPSSRRYSLWRNLTELKDLPRSIMTFRKTAFDLSQMSRSFSPKELRDLTKRSGNTLKDLPNEWLSYWFGWKQLYNSIVDLTKAPERAAREVNRLMVRSGKPTTYRISRTVVDAISATPLFDYDFLSNVFNLSTSGQHERTAEIRAVLNATFDFPRVDIPYFRRELFLKKLGVYPSATDIYNLTPWTWLFDWFSGIGSYVELVDAVNNDPSLINYGFITVVVNGRHSTHSRCRTVHTHGWRNNPAAGVTVNSDHWSGHTSIIEYRTQLRRSLGAVIGGKTTLDLLTLSAWQKSILGALVSQRVFKR